MGISNVRKRKFLNPHFVLQPVSVSYFTCLCFNYMHETVGVVYPPLHICAKHKERNKQENSTNKSHFVGINFLYHMLEGTIWCLRAGNV